jgi:hypothetical protein
MVMTVVPPGLMVIIVINPELPVDLLAVVVMAGAAGFWVSELSAVALVDTGMIALVVLDDFGVVTL